MIPNRLKFMLLGLMVLLSLTTGCRPQYEEPEQNTLQLSSTALSFLANPSLQSGNEVMVEVQTNATQWHYLTQSDWIKLRKEGAKLAVSVAPHRGTMDRRAEVVVLAGSEMAKLVVVQSAAELLLEVSTAIRSIGEQGGELLIPVSTNAGEWTIDVDDVAKDWLQISAHRSFLRVVAEPNTLGDARVARITLKAQERQSQLTITQAGLVRTFQSPYLIPSFTSSRDLIEREASQYNNELLYFYAGNNRIQDLPDTYTFACRSSHYRTVEYAFSYDEPHLLVSVTYSAHNIKDKLASEEFRRHLTGQGFVLSKEAQSGMDFTGQLSRSEGVYVVKVRMRVSGTHDLSQVVYTFEEGQPQDYPTFDSFPWGNAHYLSNANYPYQKIKGLETAEGKKMMESGKITGGATELFQTLQINMDRSYHPLLRRTYRFAKGSADVPPTELAYEIEDRYDSAYLGLWRNSLNNWLLTREFEALLQNAGFERLETNDTFEFMHRESGVKLVVRAAFMSGKYALSMRFVAVQ